MTELLLLDELVARLEKLFTGYTLLNNSGELQEVKIFAQYLPMPQGLEVVTGKAPSNYESTDYEANFPCVVVKLQDTTDKEENRIDASICAVKLLVGSYDGVPSSASDDTKAQYEARRRKCQGYRDVLNMQEKIREEFLNERITAQRFRMLMPLKSRLLEADAWPLYFGEMEMLFECGRPMQKDFVYQMKRRV